MIDNRPDSMCPDYVPDNVSVRPLRGGGRTLLGQEGADRYAALPGRLLTKIANVGTAGIPRAARREIAPAVCDCGAVVLVGLDDEPCGVAAVADPLPLGTGGEAAALLAGRPTYDLRGIVIFTITRRTAFDISRGRGGNRIVLAAHECGQPVPAEWSE